MNARKPLLALVLALLAGGLLLAPTATAAERTVEVFLHDIPSFHIAPERIDVAEGDVVTLLIRNPEDQEANHDFKLDGYDQQTGVLEPGQETTLEFVADKAGEFEYYSTLPGRKAGGERGTLYVTAAAGENEAPGPAALVAVAGIAAAALLATARRK